MKNIFFYLLYLFIDGLIGANNKNNSEIYLEDFKNSLFFPIIFFSFKFGYNFLGLIYCKNKRSICQ